MSKGKQTTLLQTWGYEGNDPGLLSQSQQSSKQKPKMVLTAKSQANSSLDDVFGHDDEEDALLARAMEESLAECSNQPKV
jgi:hypothetical protein